MFALNARSVIGAVLALGLFSAAVWVLHAELRELQIADVTRSLSELPRGAVLTAAALALLNYLMMAGYDGLALRQLGRPLGVLRTLQAAFVGYAYSNNLGFQVVSGTTVRYRLYSRWGLDGNELARLVLFNLVAVHLGIITLLGVALIAGPPVRLLEQAPEGVWTTLGIALLSVPPLYLIACAWIRGTLRIRQFELDLPRPGLGAGQISVGVVDWWLGALILWMLLPGGDVPFTTLLGVFLLAQVLGLASQVPGGLGVFEGTVLLLLGDAVPREALLSALLFFRLVYYVLPLLVATGVLVLDTLPRQRFSGWLGTLTHAILPRAMAGLVFASGALLVISSAAPIQDARLEWLLLAVPEPVLAWAHVLSAIVGVSLLLLAPILLWRRYRAWVTTQWILAAGLLLVLIGGLRFEMAVFLTIVLVLSHGARAEFRRPAPLRSAPLSAQWSLAAALVVFGLFWLVAIEHRDVDLVSRMLEGGLWRETGADAERVVRAALAASMALAGGLGLRMLGPPENTPLPLRTAPIQEALLQTGAPVSAPARLRLPGARYGLYHVGHRSLLPYAAQGRSLIAIGDPLQPGGDDELLQQFTELASAGGRQPVVLGASHRLLPAAGDLGLTFTPLGAAATVRVDTLSEQEFERDQDGRTRALHTHGIDTRVIDPDAPAHEVIRERLIAETRWTQPPAADACVVLIERDRRILGLLSAVPGYGTQRELALEWLRTHPDAPPGSREAMVGMALEWARSHGVRRFHLGMAAPDHPSERRRLDATRQQRRLAALFSPDPERSWRALFHPRWEARYLIHSGGLALPRALRDAADRVRHTGLQLR